MKSVFFFGDNEVKKRMPRIVWNEFTNYFRATVSFVFIVIAVEWVARPIHRVINQRRSKLRTRQMVIEG